MTELRRRFPPGVGDIADELLRLVANETGVPFAVIDLDGVVHYASGSVTTLGWEPDAVVGSNILDYIDGDSHELAAAGMAEFADGLETHEGLPVDFEMCRQDGSRFWVEVGGTPVHARDGRMFVVLRLRHSDAKHHLDEFFVALTEADSFEAVMSPLVRSITAEAGGVAAAVHHGFDGRAFAGVVSCGLPPGLLLDPAPWVTWWGAPRRWSAGGSPAAPGRGRRRRRGSSPSPGRTSSRPPSSRCGGRTRDHRCWVTGSSSTATSATSSSPSGGSPSTSSSATSPVTMR